jgi:phosphoglycolate phosphatase-like HAD superfamily hydrolase
MKPFANIKFLLCDWDGTLVDSMPNYTQSFAKIMKDTFNIPETKSTSFYRKTAGQALSLQILECAKKFTNHTPENTLPLENQFMDKLQIIQPPLLEGAKDFLTKIKNKGIKITIWSGTRTDVLRKYIQILGLANLVDFAIGNEPGSKTIVKGPGLLEFIIKHFQIPNTGFIQQCLVIGDGIGDIQAGKTIGAKTAAFIKNDGLSLINSNADFFFKTYDELLRNLV